MSIEPIRNVVGSKDSALIKSFSKDNPDYAEAVKKMINSPPQNEPGCWNYLIRVLADHLKLSPDDDLDFNEGFKHYHTWEPYREELADIISPEIDSLLEHLQSGRPLKGDQVEHDGCVFAWLTKEEARELYVGLSEIDSDEIVDEDMEMTHTAFVESLEVVCRRGHALLLQGH